MFRNLVGCIVLLLAAAPSAAHAGFGATAALGGLSDGTVWAPSLDVRFKGVHLSLQALDTIGGLTAEQLNLGLGGAFVVVKRQIGGEIEGTLSPGARIRYFQYIGDRGDALAKSKTQGSGFNVTAQMRMGMEIKKGMGFGVYVVPQLGVSNLAGVGLGKESDAELGLTWGGGLEVSTWFLKK